MLLLGNALGSDASASQAGVSSGRLPLANSFKFMTGSSQIRKSILLNIFNALAALLLVFIGWAANAMGAFFNALFIFALLGAAVRILLTVWGACRGTLEYGLLRRPFAAELRKYWLAIFNGWLFWLLAGITLNFCIVPAQFAPNVFYGIRALEWVAIAALMLLRLLPAKRIFIATNLALAAGSVFMAVELTRITWPQAKSDGVVLSVPFHGEWLVVQGGRSPLINHHYRLASQRNALDIARIVGGRDKTGEPGKLQSYPAWGETIYAPADGVVVKVVNNRPDNLIHQTDIQNVGGNHIVIDIGDGRFVLMAHLQEKSILVSPGDRVHVGQPIAKCGNSGNTSQPHLHIQAQNRPELFTADTRTFPILFKDAVGVRFGRILNDTPFFVRRNDHLIRN